MDILTTTPAPPVTRAAGGVRRPRRGAAAGLVVLGLVVLAAVLGTGLFSTVAGGQQMIDDLAPHLHRDALARYDSDLATLRAGAGAAAADADLQRRLPGVAAWVQGSEAIDRRASDLLARVSAAEPDYRAAAAITGFDRVPLLLVAAGIAAVAAGVALARGVRGAASVVAVLLGLAVAAYPFGSGLRDGAARTERLVTAFAPVMDRAAVVAQQRDFVVVVQAVGELDASRSSGVRRPGEVEALVTAWPAISSDLASLVGTVNDEIDRYDALDALPDLALLPWGLLVLGLGTSVLTLLALPRRENP